MDTLEARSSRDDKALTDDATKIEDSVKQDVSERNADSRVYYQHIPRSMWHEPMATAGYDAIGHTSEEKGAKYMDRLVETTAAEGGLSIAPQPSKEYCTLDALSEHLNVGSHAESGSRNPVERWRSAVVPLTFETMLDSRGNSPVGSSHASDRTKAIAVQDAVTFKLGSAANDALDLALLIAEGSPLVLAVDDSNHGSSTTNPTLSTSEQDVGYESLCCTHPLI